MLLIIKLFCFKKILFNIIIHAFKHTTKYLSYFVFKKPTYYLLSYNYNFKTPHICSHIILICCFFWGGGFYAFFYQTGQLRADRYWGQRGVRDRQRTGFELGSPEHSCGIGRLTNPTRPITHTNKHIYIHICILFLLSFLLSHIFVI